MVGFVDSRTLVSLFYVNKLYNYLVRRRLPTCDWDELSKQSIPIDFVSEYKDYLNFRYVCIYTALTEDELVLFLEYLDWISVSSFQTLSESFIETYQDRVYWFAISKHQKLSNQFIQRYQNNLNMTMVTKYQKDWK